MMSSGEGARLLITGAAGFVGTALTKLVQTDHPSCEISPLGHGSTAPDIRDAHAIDEVVKDFNPTAVVHLAAIAAPAEAEASPRVAWDVNLLGSLNIAQAVRRHAPRARFIFAGSSESYGASFKECAGRPISENALLRPQSVYAATKAAADLMLGQMAHDGLDVVRFRPFNHTGPGQTDVFVIPAFAKQVAEAAAGRRPRVIEVGNLDAERDFIDVRDVVRAYARAAIGSSSRAGSGEIYNLASGRPIKIGAVLDRLIALSGIEVEVRVDPKRLRPNDLPVACGDATAARTDFGWRPEVPLETTISNVFDFWKAQVSL